MSSYWFFQLKLRITELSLHLFDFVSVFFSYAENLDSISNIT